MCISCLKVPPLPFSWNILIVHMNMIKGLRYMLVQWLLPNLMEFVLHVHGNNMIISWRLIFVHCRLFTRHMFMYMDVDRINSVIIIFYCMKCFPWAWHTLSPVTSVEYITVQLVHFSSGPIFDLMKLYSAALTSGTPHPQFRLPPTLQPQALYHTWVTPFLF